MNAVTVISDQSKQLESINAVIVSATIFKLVEAIEKKIKAGQTDKDLEELKQLREQCGSDNPLVSVTACHGLVYLVRSFICPLPNTIAALVTSLFSVKSVTGVASALTELLVLELKCHLASEPVYSCPYNTKSPQHPLVAVLKRRPLAWPDVLNQVSAVCTHSDKLVKSHRLELVKPVFVYVLMESNDLPESCRLQAFRIIIQHFSDKDFLVEALAACLCWEESRVLEAVQAVSMLGQSAAANKHGLHVSLCCLVLAALVPRLLRAALCPQAALRQLAWLVKMSANTHSTVMALLATSITTCPAVYLEHLLAFFVELLSQDQCSPDCTWMCVSALMPWLVSSATQLREALHTATLIVSHASSAKTSGSSTATLITNPAVCTVVSADARLTQAIHIARLSEELRGDVSGTLRWLHSLKVIEQDQLYHYVSALLISCREPEVKLAALQALGTALAPAAASHNLTLLLYQLARERRPEIQLALLRTLPSTAVHKNNVLGVVSTIEAVRKSGNSNLSLLSIDLFCQLWICQERCYPQLMDVLNQDCSRYDQPGLAYLLQARVCKTICTAKPEMHGKEVVAKVSEILNKCGGAKDSAASALALDALIPLCRQDVVDVFTIWRSLSPRFSRDKRLLVLQSLCELLSVAAVQKSPVADDTLTQMLKWLWNLVATNKQAPVVEQALKALSKFRLDQMNLKMLPECFRRGLTLPPGMAQTPVDAARRPEDVLDYIPGECWIQLLQHVNTEAAALTVASWIKMELAALRGSAFYQVDRAEPSGYGHLPHSSVVRGVTHSLQQLCKSLSDPRAVDLCLLALLQPTPKPLPSLSWAFLGDVQDPTLILNIVRLTAKQSQISPSARKITENYIAASGSDKDKIEFLYSVLSDLCRGIPPNTLRPFLERTLNSAVNQKSNEHFTVMVGHLEATLKEEKIHEANRTMLTQQVKALWDILEPQSDMLSVFLSCVSELPISVVESMSSTSLMWEVTSAQLQKAFRLRAFMALVPQVPQPLNWLNEIIEVASTNISEQSLALRLVTEVMSQLHRDATAWPWLQELMGQTHQYSVNNKGGIDFLVSVFVLCVDIMAGYSSLATEPQNTRALRLPQAVARLVSQHGEAKSMLEWLNHMRSVDSFPSQFSAAFQLATRNVSLILG